MITVYKGLRIKHDAQQTLCTVLDFEHFKNYMTLSDACQAIDEELDFMGYLHIVESHFEGHRIAQAISRLLVVFCGLHKMPEINKDWFLP